MGWKQLGRKTIYSTKFLKLFEDTVELPNGQVLDDYSLLKFPDSVVIVATDENDKVLVFSEYKYAINQEVLSFPAGSIEENQTPIEAAIRELMEETGYASKEVEIIGESQDYPSKIQHTDYIVRIKNAKKVSDTNHEATESISEVRLIPISEIGKLWRQGEIKGAYMITAIACAFPEQLVK